jgi:peroxin-19
VPTAPPPTAVPATASATAPPTLDAELGALDDDADFMRALQAGMAEMLGEMESSPEMAKQFEDMMRQLGGGGIPGLGALGGLSGAASAAVAADAEKKSAAAAAAAPAADKAAPDAKGKAPGEDGTAAQRGEEPPADFQESIRRTMERMRESGEAAGAAAAGAAGQGAAGAAGGDGEADLMAALLREMGEGGAGAGEGSEEDFSKMLLGMMEQLTNKEILYEPMKELHDKFPAWLAENRGKTPEADLKRYEEQQRLVGEIVGKF